MADTSDRVAMMDNMTDHLDQDLDFLRRRLQRLQPPEHLESELRAAFAARRAGGSAGGRGMRRLAAVLAAGVAIGALVTAVVGVQQPVRPVQQAFEMSGPSGAPVASTALSREPPFPQALSFQPLAYARQASPRESYSVLRVRVPITMIPAGGYELQGSVEADVLLGVDGLASGIRFDAGTAVFETVSAEQY